MSEAHVHSSDCEFTVRIYPTDFPTPTSSVHFLIHIFELESLAVNSVLNLSYMYSRYIFHTHIQHLHHCKLFSCAYSTLQ